jgi:general secretion pathway protein M
MKDWWLSRTPNDRMASIIAICVVVVLMIYLFFWVPFNKQIVAKRALVENQLATLQWMQKSAAEVLSLRNRDAGTKTSGSTEALLTLVDRTAKQNQLRQYIQRIKPQDNNTVQLWLEETPFDNLMQWLGTLVKQYNIFLESISIERQEKSGMVDARLTLQRESS